jgi:hypothetical protein
MSARPDEAPRAPESLPARSRLPNAMALALAALLIASAYVPPWELFHDELYYWAGAQRLGLGYVDHPPLAPWLLRLVTAVLGDGRLAFRIVPALCGAATLLLASAMARRFGAGAWGQATAGLAVATTPVFLTFFSFYSVNALELLLWTAICCAFADLVRSGDERRWVAIGALAGVAALDKHTVALLGVGLLAGILTSPMRAHLRRRWIWMGGALALLCALPNLAWNQAHEWPSLDFYRSRGEGILPASFGEALFLQVMAFSPANALLWLPGLAFLLFSRRMRPYRPLGVAFLLLLVGILVSGQRRADRIGGIYPVAFAAGAAFWERGSGRSARIARASISTLVLGVGILLLPISLTLFPPERVEAFFQRLGEPPEIETGDVGQWMPLTLLGRLEWRRFGEEVFDAFDALPAEDRAHSVILTPHWLYAAVLEYYGRDRELAPVVSPHNAYAFWHGGASELAGRDRVITVAIPQEVAERWFAEVRPLAVFECAYCTAWRPDIPVLLARGSSRPLADLLEEWRTYSIGLVPALAPNEDYE